MSEIQSVIFDKGKFSRTTAREWLIAHKFKHDDMRYTTNHIRFRQLPPRMHAKYATKKAADGVEYILMFIDEPTNNPFNQKKKINCLL